MLCSSLANTSMQAQYKHNNYYLVRHGEAENNVLGILNSLAGRTEYPLTVHGRAMVRLTADYLKPHQPNFIVASPVLRTRETAEIIQGVLGVPLMIDKRLCENRFGQFEGAPIQEYLAFVQSRGGRLHDITDVDIEGYASIRERAAGFLRDTAEHFSEQKIVIVSHGDFLQEMYYELLGEPVTSQQSERRWYPETGSCAFISADADPQQFVPA